MGMIRVAIVLALLSTTALAQRSADMRTPANGSFQSVIEDLKPSLAGPTTLVVEAGRCWGANKPRATATITGGDGSGSFVVYCTDTQTIVFEHSTPATVSCSNCIESHVTTPAVPEGLYKIADGTIAGGKFASVVDQRDFMTGHRHSNGAGMNTQCSGGVCVDQIDTAAVQLKADNYTPVAGMDAAGATMTRPFRMGTVLSSTCKPGEFFYLTGGAAGRRLNECVAPNRWSPVTVQAGSQRPGHVVANYFPAVTAHSCESLITGNNWSLPRVDAAMLPARDECGTSAPTRAGLIFPAKTVSTGYITTTVPPDWHSGIDARVFIERDSHIAAKGDWKLDVAMSCSSSGQQYADGKFNRPTQVTVPARGTGQIMPVRVAALDTTGCEAGDLITVQIRRAGQDAADTSPYDVKILGIELAFRTE